MSQSKHENGPTPTAATIAIELRSGVAPSNDNHRAARVARAGLLGLPATYWVLWGGMLLNRLGGTIFMLLGIYLTRERGLSAPVAGLIISLDAAGGLFAGPIAGALADRLGRRPTLLLGTTGSALLMLAFGQARTTALIVALAPLLGFFTDLCRPPLQAAVADLVPPRDRARAYGLFYWAMNVGFAVAASLGGALAARHFGLLFTLDALSTFAFGLVVLVGVPETRPALPASGVTRLSAQRGFSLCELAAPFRDGAFVRFTAIQLLLLVAFAQVIVALPLDMQAHGLAPAQIGWLLGLNGLFIVVAQPLALRVLRRFGHLAWLATGAALIGLGLGAIGLAHGVPGGYLAAIALWTAGEIGISTAAPALVADLAPIDRRGAYQGTYQLAWGTANTIAPALGSLVLARFGGAPLWLGCLVAGVVAAGLHLRFTRPRGGGRA
jgi:MFS family permease